MWLLKPIFIGYKGATCLPIKMIQEMIHEPYRYRRRYPDGLFVGP